MQGQGLFNCKLFIEFKKKKCKLFTCTYEIEAGRPRETKQQARLLTYESWWMWKGMRRIAISIWYLASKQHKQENSCAFGISWHTGKGI